MNHHLIEVLLGIFHLDEESKTLYCLWLPDGDCGSHCNVCPLGYTGAQFNGKPHYLHHLIALTRDIT